MSQTRIQLDDGQVDRLSALAAQRGVSLAYLVHEALEAWLTEEQARLQDEKDEKKRRALAAVGRFASGSHDVSIEHDRYLDSFSA